MAGVKGNRWTEPDCLRTLCKRFYSAVSTFARCGHAGRTLWALCGLSMGILIEHFRTFLGGRPLRERWNLARGIAVELDSVCHCRFLWKMLCSRCRVQVDYHVWETDVRIS